MAQSLLKIIANFQTTLAAAISSSATSATLTSATTKDGTTLPAGTYGFTIDEGKSNEEHIVATVSSTALSSMLRGVSVVDGVTEISGLKFAHRKGATIKITNHPGLMRILRILNGTVDLDGATPLKYDTAPTITDPKHIATKAYADSLVLGVLTTINVIVPGKAGETVANGNLLYFDETDNEWKKCDADTAATVDNVLLGIAQGAGTDGVAITDGVLLQGVDDAQSGLVEGDVMYASNTAGGISTTPGTNEVTIGIARSATELYFAPRFNQVLTEGQQDALVGTEGTPSTSNPYATKTTTDKKLGQEGAAIYAADAGASDAYAVTLSPVPSAYTTGMVVNFKANTVNTGEATLNVNGLGAKIIKKNKDQTLANGDIKAGQLVTVIYDGTDFQMQSQIANTVQSPPFLPQPLVGYSAPDATNEPKNITSLADSGDALFMVAMTGTNGRVIRYAKDALTGVYYKTHSVNLSNSAVNARSMSVTALGSFVYVSYINNGTTQWNVTRFNIADLTGETNMTISGTSVSGSSACQSAFNDGTNFYFSDSAAISTHRKYSLSGTTLTYVSDVNFGTSNQAWSDNSFVYFTSSDEILKKQFNGTAVSTTARNLAYQTPLNTTTPIGFFFGSSAVMFAVLKGLVDTNAAAYNYQMWLTPITKP